MGSRKKLWTGEIKFETLLQPFFSNKTAKFIPFTVNFNSLVTKSLLKVVMGFLAY